MPKKLSLILFTRHLAVANTLHSNQFRCLSYVAKYSRLYNFSNQRVLNAQLNKQPFLKHQHCFSSSIQSSASAISDTFPKSGSEAVFSQLSFKDTRTIYSNVGTGELIKSGILLSSLQFGSVFQHADFLLKLSQKIFGKPLTLYVIRHTLFRQFCGGENLDELIETGLKLTKRQIGTIVDYSAESEDTENTTLADNWLDTNVQLTIDGIVSSGKLKKIAKKDFAFLAVKVTSMCRPLLLRKITACLNLLHTLYSEAVGIDKVISIHNPMNHDILCEKSLSKQQTTDLLNSLWVDTEKVTKQQIQEYVEKMSSLHSGYFKNSQSIFYIQFMDFFTPSIIATLPSPHIKVNDKLTKLMEQSYWLTAEDAAKWALAENRFEECFKVAKEHNVRLLVDAEQTFYQTAIDYVAMKGMEKFCKITDSSLITETPALLYNTYQCYLKNAFGKLKFEMKRAELLQYRLGAKLVRGAYINQETRCSSEGCYDNPVNSTIQDTHSVYDSSIQYMMERLPKHEMLCGTHNEQSITKAAKLLSEISEGVPQKYPVTFAQLLGMCDYMSLQLGRVGARVYKYVPYGPIHLVLPYLMRRAMENASIFGSAKKESQLIWKEVVRRILFSFGIV